MSQRTVEVVVHGVVQGVGFRYTGRAEAARLGVAAELRNESDGTVRGRFSGDADAVADMVDWCHRGPRFAEVSRVDVREVG